VMEASFISYYGTIREAVSPEQKHLTTRESLLCSPKPPKGRKLIPRSLQYVDTSLREDEPGAVALARHPTENEGYNFTVTVSG